MRFAELLAGSELDAALRAEIDELLERKQRASEAEYGLRRRFIACVYSRGTGARGNSTDFTGQSRWRCSGAR